MCCFGADFGFFGVQLYLVCNCIWCAFFGSSGDLFKQVRGFVFVLIFFARICFIFLIFIDFVFCLGPILILILC